MAITTPGAAASETVAAHTGCEKRGALSFISTTVTTTWMGGREEGRINSLIGLYAENCIRTDILFVLVRYRPESKITNPKTKMASEK